MTSGTMARSPRALAAARQRIEFRTGDEAAAIAARAAGFEPADAASAPPSSAVALACGAAMGGLRVVASTTSQGLVGALERLALQACARVPMVLNVAARPLGAPDAGCDHSAIHPALGTGCIVLAARDPQAVYDMNLAAVRIGEHADVRLPVIVAYDGHATSDEKRRILIVDDAEALALFLGARAPTPTPLDFAHAATYGAALDEEALLENRAQVSQAMEMARGVIAEVFAELAALTGRAYPAVDAHAMEDAEAAIVLLNSAAQAAKEAVDVWRGEDRKVGIVSPNVLRPFPAEELRALLRPVKAVTVGDRGGFRGAAPLATEIRAALQEDPENATQVLSRIFGAGGTAFDASDAERLLDEAFAASKGDCREAFAHHPAARAREEAAKGLPPLRTGDAVRGMASVHRDEASGKLQVELAPLWKMTAAPSRIAPGHGACPGCGVFPMLHQVHKVLEGDLVFLFESGCAIAVTASRSATAHRVSCVHDATANGASTLCGLAEAWRERVRRGELPAGSDPTFVMVAGDGAVQAGLADIVDAANRNPRMIVLEYDNQARSSAGGQPTRSSAAAPRRSDTAQVLAACHLPYVFTACEGFPEDLMRKAAKAQWYARNEGMAYGRILSFCPLHWQAPDDAAQPALQAAIDSCFFPLYEIERGCTSITYDPDALGRRKPVSEWLKATGRTVPLLDPGSAAMAQAIQAETDRRWSRLKAMHDHPLL